MTKFPSAASRAIFVGYLPGVCSGSPSVTDATTAFATARADFAALPDQLERVDRWIEEGVLGGEQPNAADLQIGSTIRLLLSIADVRPLIADHPAAGLAKWFPPMVGEIEAGVLPAEWLPASV